MHKNKRRLLKEKGKNKWWKIIEWAIIIVVGLVIGAWVANWMNTLPFFQPHYAKPSEFGLQNGIPLLTGYCLGLVLMMVSGYLFMRRVDNGLPKDSQVAHQHIKVASDSRKKRFRR
jgi:hypothetical protein